MKFSIKAVRGATDVIRLTVEAGDLAAARLAAAGQGLQVLLRLDLPASLESV